MCFCETRTHTHTQLLSFIGIDLQIISDRLLLSQDPKRNVVKKFDGTNTINGVFSGDFQLSEVPALGEWKITATIGDQVCVGFISLTIKCGTYFKY